jgi:hypothetical protein
MVARLDMPGGVLSQIDLALAGLPAARVSRRWHSGEVKRLEKDVIGLSSAGKSTTGSQH